MLPGPFHYFELSCLFEFLLVVVHQVDGSVVAIANEFVIGKDQASSGYFKGINHSPVFRIQRNKFVPFNGGKEVIVNGYKSPKIIQNLL